MKMQDLSTSETAGLLAWLAAIAAKVLPPALGVAVMAVVDKPDTNRELMLRMFVALACSYLFGDVVFDGLRANVDWLAFLDASKRSHTFAVEAVVGGIAYSALAVAAKYLRKLRAASDPVAVIVEDAKKAGQ